MWRCRLSDHVKIFRRTGQCVEEVSSKGNNKTLGRTPQNKRLARREGKKRRERVDNCVVGHSTTVLCVFGVHNIDPYFRKLPGALKSLQRGILFKLLQRGVLFNPCSMMISLTLTAW
ncbi:hypothetical protein PoB_007546200 [Plakobranchus ocellatus]|uniref:Uncharacterized protein n=1 Tax=Plakobranchus ocellatus TaxID=259542 RepID=A0AAV4DXD0_9GAST|nr:hypothetical protein PoB_007546200 [Plakobranchus ocellatus]